MPSSENVQPEGGGRRMLAGEESGAGGRRAAFRRASHLLEWAACIKRARRGSDGWIRALSRGSGPKSPEKNETDGRRGRLFKA